MRLRAKDQISISSVKADSLRPGEEFEVSDEAGEELLRKHPRLVERIAEPKAEKPVDETRQTVPAATGRKAENPPQNKAEGPAPSNKAAASPKGRKKAR